ncbi:MAG: toxin-antitoxin system protein [Candidatus Viridilinea halotolerans]|uniref:Toxin-antitoxin system protein n=1 Tax=Candidatus Viridilinea halotolerans TaxID=2491704 RepID=A0A426U5E9_9CHLR|nr:MAG: toxin-antitoxin system protein [Candidatus Viridilinea halotolerans]
MTTTTIRVSTQTHRTLTGLAQRAGLPMAEVVEQAIELYRRQRMLEEANAAYAALRQDATAWAELQAERTVWDATVGDGLQKV